MSLRIELLKVLDNSEEPLQKRLKIAENAFNSTELPLPHKEAFLLEWILKNVDNDVNIWKILELWLKSNQFKELSRNDISSEELHAIIELILCKLSNESDISNNSVSNVLLPIFENRVFELYFIHNVEIYCKFMSSVLRSITEGSQFVDFIKKNSIFYKNMLVEEKYPKYFLGIIVPEFVRIIKKFEGNNFVFEEISKIVQKNILYGNGNKFESFLNQFFEDTTSEKHNVTKVLLKNLVTVNAELKETYFKLILHSFCQSYKDFGLSYKLFIILVHLSGFNLSENLIIHKISKLQTNNLDETLHILSALFEVLSNNNNTLDHKINDLAFTDFIKNILLSLIFLRSPNAVTYKIFLYAIKINPLIIESIINNFVAYSMVANNEKCLNDYENIIIATFEVFSKLRRIESFVAKLIQSLQKSLQNDFDFEEVYSFTGINSIDVISNNLNVNDIFTESIKKYFTKCIYSLASWQVINLLKTMLFHLETTVKSLDENNFENNQNNVIFLEILSVLTSWLLQSVRMAEHTIPANVVEKFVKGLDDLKEILKNFGTTLLHKKHNCATMKSFLHIVYTYGTIYTTMAFYNNDVIFQKTIDNKFIACNISYIHSYLSVDQWCSISERINNFGEPQCKILFQKLLFQKLKTMLLFETNINEDIVLNVIKYVSNNIEETWNDILVDKYVINYLLPKMENETIILLAEKFVGEENLYKKQHLIDSSLFRNAVNYVALNKINKAFKRKRKVNESFGKIKSVSAEILSTISEDFFINNYDLEFSKAKEIFFEAFESDDSDLNIKISENNLIQYLKILKDVPIIFSSDSIVGFVLLYLFAVHKDIGNNFLSAREECENIIIGILSHTKTNILNVFDNKNIFSFIIKTFTKYNKIFSLFIENIFKNEDSIKKIEDNIPNITENLSNPKFLECSLIIVNAANKIKKSKYTPETKKCVNDFKESILKNIEKQLHKKDPDGIYIEPFATCLKNYLINTDNLNNNSVKIFKNMQSYLDYSIKNIDNKFLRGYLLLFFTILNNKQKLKMIDDDIILKIWKSLKNVNIDDENFDDFQKIVGLIFTNIKNEDFDKITLDLLSFMESALENKNNVLIIRELKILESIVSCNVNQVKTKIWQDVLENIWLRLWDVIKLYEFDEELFKNIVKFGQSIIQAHHFTLTPPLIDILLTISTLLANKNEFYIVYNLSISILEKLLKSRNALMMDRLPTFLQCYRQLLNSLCKNSNCDLNLPNSEVNQLADCAHKLEKLTNLLVLNKKDMTRISVYLVGDILVQYEKVTMYRNVKVHLDNCVYSLVSLFDNHSIAYVMRVMSSASTQIFKRLYENYKRFYMFTGKV